MRLGLKLIHVLSGYKSYIPETAFYILKIIPVTFKTPPVEELTGKIEGKSIPTTLHGILQARLLEWVGISFSRVFSQPRDRTRSPALQADSLPTEPPGKPFPTTLKGF